MLPSGLRIPGRKYRVTWGTSEYNTLLIIEHHYELKHETLNMDKRRAF